METLQKTRFTSKEQFERRFIKQLSQTKYEPGELVLIHNTSVLFEVFKRTNGRNYKLQELDGPILPYKYTAFCILPYITRDHKFMHYHLQINEGEQSNGDFKFESESEDSDLEN